MQTVSVSSSLATDDRGDTLLMTSFLLYVLFLELCTEHSYTRRQEFVFTERRVFVFGGKKYC